MARLALAAGGEIARCGECRFAKRQGFDAHHCRKHAPVAERVDAAQDLRRWVPRWPIVKGDDWCGDFERKEHVNGQ